MLAQSAHQKLFVLPFLKLSANGSVYGFPIASGFDIFISVWSSPYFAVRPYCARFASPSSVFIVISYCVAPTTSSRFTADMFPSAPSFRSYTVYVTCCGSTPVPDAASHVMRTAVCMSCSLMFSGACRALAFAAPFFAARIIVSLVLN